jgi:acyl-CoA synthetase (AMP-forming)/AMP-acid ligase II
MILEDYLERNARLYPQKTAIVCGELKCTYKELYARVREHAELLSMQRSQTPVCLRAECSIDYLVTYFALHRAGCIVVPLEKDIPEETFQSINSQFSVLSSLFLRASPTFSTPRAPQASRKE